MRHYSIGEVCEALGIKQHVLRYWEQEVPMIRPGKDRGGRREYTSADLNLLFRLKYLVQSRLFTVPGAYKQLLAETSGADGNIKARLASLRGELLELKDRNRMLAGSAVRAMDPRRLYPGQEQLFENWEARPDRMREVLVLDSVRFPPEYVDEILALNEQADGVMNRLPDTKNFAIMRAAGLPRSYRLQGISRLHEGRIAVMSMIPESGAVWKTDAHPGTIPVSPVRKLSLFGMLAEKIRAASLLVGRSFPWFVCVRARQHHHIVDYFYQNEYFGLPKDSIHFVPVEDFPYLDGNRLVLGHDGGIASYAGGPGACFRAISGPDFVQRLEEHKVEDIYCMPLENPMPGFPHPEFLGLHEARSGGVSAKAVRGDRFAGQGSGGKLFYPTGVYIVRTSVLRRLHATLPFAAAEDRIDTVNPASPLDDTQNRAVRRLALRMMLLMIQPPDPVIMDVDPQAEYCPLQTNDGPYSPAYLAERLSDKFYAWLEEGERIEAGQGVYIDASQELIEVSPFYAPDRQAFRARMESSS